MRVLTILMLVLISTIIPFQKNDISAAEIKKHKVLIVYHNNSEEQQLEIRKLDLLIGHFTTDITIKQVNEVINKDELNDFTHIFYFGQRKKSLSRDEILKLSNYTGVLFYLGKDIQQFEKNALDNINDNEKLTVLFSDLNSEKPYPLIYKKGEIYYMNTETIYGELGEKLGEILFDVFNTKRSDGVKSLRLEDVHPKSNPRKLEEIGAYLSEQNIPYMITVIPVYYNPETTEEIHLAESPKLVKVLRKMQENGASIILHGYHHQYRETETGEGFEYWDVDNDRPIYQDKDEKVLFRKDFKSKYDYDAHIKKGEAFEKEYIKSTVTKGITELVEEGIYPLAFEAPHYTMSQLGYKELSKYFSTYIGQIQISDETYMKSYTPFYHTEPLMLGGMRLYPETMGYIEPNNKHAIENMLEESKYISTYSDAHLSFFYHPYLELDRLQEIVQKMNLYEEYQWFDLKKIKIKKSVNLLFVFYLSEFLTLK